MSDYTKQIKDALDIIKYDSDIADTLSELRGKWDIPALRDPRLDSVAKQYITLPHTEGVDALGQELSSLGWLLYDLDGDDIYLFVLIPTASVTSLSDTAAPRVSSAGWLHSAGAKSVRARGPAVYPSLYRQPNTIYPSGTGSAAGT